MNCQTQNQFIFDALRKLIKKYKHCIANIAVSRIVLIFYIFQISFIQLTVHLDFLLFCIYIPGEEMLNHLIMYLMG